MMDLCGGPCASVRQVEVPTILRLDRSYVLFSHCPVMNGRKSYRERERGRTVQYLFSFPVT